MACRAGAGRVGWDRMAGKDDETLVVYARFEAAARQDCLSTVGRTIEAIAKPPSECTGVKLVMQGKSEVRWSSTLGIL